MHYSLRYGSCYIKFYYMFHSNLSVVAAMSCIILLPLWSLKNPSNILEAPYSGIPHLNVKTEIVKKTQLFWIEAFYCSSKLTIMKYNNIEISCVKWNIMFLSPSDGLGGKGDIFMSENISFLVGQVFFPVIYFPTF